MCRGLHGWSVCALMCSGIWSAFHELWGHGVLHWCVKHQLWLLSHLLQRDCVSVCVCSFVWFQEAVITKCKFQPAESFCFLHFINFVLLFFVDVCKWIQRSWSDTLDCICLYWLVLIYYFDENFSVKCKVAKHWLQVLLLIKSLPFIDHKTSTRQRSEWCNLQILETSFIFNYIHWVMCQFYFSIFQVELQSGNGLKFLFFFFQKTKYSHWCSEKLYLIWWRLRIVTMLMSEPVRFALLYSPDVPPTSCRTTYLHVSHLFPSGLLLSWCTWLSSPHELGCLCLNHPAYPAVCVLGPFCTWIVWATQLIVPGDLNGLVGLTDLRKKFFWVLCNWLWFQINSDILPLKVWHSLL